MRRREFIALLGGSAATWPLAALAQQPSLPVIGYLESVSQGQFADLIPAFRKGLSETGFIDGQNVRIEYRWAEGQYDRLPTLTAELVHDHATLIFTTALISAQAAKAVTTTVPIVFVSGPDPVQLGLVASLNRPGGNLTGVTLFTSTVGAKRLQLMRELLPAATTFAFVVNPSNTRADSDVEEMETAARALGQQIIVAKASTDRDLETAFATLAQRSIQALVIGGDPFFNGQAQQLVALASHYAIPTVYPLHEFAAAGGLMSYGSSISDAYRQAGIYAGHILKGAKPADLPVMQPTKFELVINLKTARTLGVEIPATLLARADEVIE
jgi:putative tryptophan/tyrosine transport system substrate-binding protein